jgi:hypothetical protein
MYLPLGSRKLRNARTAGPLLQRAGPLRIARTATSTIRKEHSIHNQRPHDTESRQGRRVKRPLLSRSIADAEVEALFQLPPFGSVRARTRARNLSWQGGAAEKASNADECEVDPLDIIHGVTARFEIDATKTLLRISAFTRVSYFESSQGAWDAYMRPDGIDPPSYGLRRSRRPDPPTRAG